MIRLATHDDLDRLVELGSLFHAYSPFQDIAFDTGAFRSFAEKLLIGGVILLSEDGMLGGMTNPVFFNPAFVGAVELFWYAPKTGRQLREAFEAWAREQGASMVQFASLADEHAPVAARLMRRAGYVPTETAYRKVL